MAEISPIHCNPRGGDGNLRSYIKEGNLTRGGLLHPRITAAKSHVVTSPVDPISMGEGSQEAQRERRQWHRRRDLASTGACSENHEGRGLRAALPHDVGGREGAPRAAAGAPAPLAALFIIFTTISITNSSLYTVIYPPTHLCTVLCKHGV
jgi:hypothetical protein